MAELPGLLGHFIEHELHQFPVLSEEVFHLAPEGALHTHPCLPPPFLLWEVAVISPAGPVSSKKEHSLSRLHVSAV